MMLIGATADTVLEPVSAERLGRMDPHHRRSGLLMTAGLAPPRLLPPTATPLWALAALDGPGRAGRSHR